MSAAARKRVYFSNNSQMQYNNKSALSTPLINRVVYLNKQLVEHGRKLPHGKACRAKDGSYNMSVDVRRCYMYPLIEKAGILFIYALRQLRGNDYLKRALDIVEEIQAQCYLITEMRGWNERVCAGLDLLCDEIADQLRAIAAAQKSRSQ